MHRWQEPAGGRLEQLPTMQGVKVKVAPRASLDGVDQVVKPGSLSISIPHNGRTHSLGHRLTDAAQRQSHGATGQQADPSADSGQAGPPRFDPSRLGSCRLPAPAEAKKFDCGTAEIVAGRASEPVKRPTAADLLRALFGVLLAVQAGGPSFTHAEADRRDDLSATDTRARATSRPAAGPRAQTTEEWG